MRRKMILVLGLSVLALVVLVAAGCGGDSKNAAATTEEVTTEAVTTEEATTEETTTEAATTEAATTEATTTESGGTVVSAGDCKELADLSSSLSTAFSGTANADSIKKEAAILNQLADKAPSEIQADFRTMAAFVAKVADIYGNITPGQVPDAATLQRLQGLQTDAAKVTTASQNIAAWVTKNCHA